MEKECKFKVGESVVIKNYVFDSQDSASKISIADKKWIAKYVKDFLSSHEFCDNTIGSFVACGDIGKIVAYDEKHSRYGVLVATDSESLLFLLNEEDIDNVPKVGDWVKATGSLDGDNVFARRFLPKYAKLYADRLKDDIYNEQDCVGVIVETISFWSVEKQITTNFYVILNTNKKHPFVTIQEYKNITSWCSEYDFVRAEEGDEIIIVRPVVGHTSEVNVGDTLLVDYNDFIKVGAGKNAFYHNDMEYIILNHKESSVTSSDTSNPGFIFKKADKGDLIVMIKPKSLASGYLPIGFIGRVEKVFPNRVIIDNKPVFDSEESYIILNQDVFESFAIAAVSDDTLINELRKRMK